MNVLRKCCFRSMRENRKRTAVTVIGIILATALITGVACLAVSFRAGMIAYEKAQYGDFHYCFAGVSREKLSVFENNRHISKIAVAELLGYATLEDSQNPDKPYLYIRATDEAGMETLALHLYEGRMPENDTELVIGRHVISNGLAELKVGDEITLEIGERFTADGYRLGQNNPYSYEEEHLEPRETRHYTIVGVTDRPNYFVEERMAPGYSAFTYVRLDKDAEIGAAEQSGAMEQNGAAEQSGTAEQAVTADPDMPLEVYVSYTDWGLRHVSRVNAGILGVSEDVYERYGQNCCTDEEVALVRAVADGITDNSPLIRWTLFSFSSRTMDTIYTMAALAILVIMVTAVFCIRNSFMISLTEKMKLYGRLASVGATSAQRRKIVFYEAMFLGVTGIPLGILAGIAASAILVRGVNGLVETALDMTLIFRISVPVIAVSAVLAAVTIFFSARKSARLAGKVSPIDAIRANHTVRIQRKELRCPKYISKLFGVGGKVAWRNLRRARVKYRATVISIVVSVAVFVGMTTFVRLGLDTSSLYYGQTPYQMRIGIYDEDACEKAARIAAMGGVQEADIVRQGMINISGDSLNLTEEYLSLGVIERDSWTVWAYSLGQESYERFCEEVGVSVEQARDKAIVIARYDHSHVDGVGRRHVVTGRIANLSPGDVLEDSGASNICLEVLTQTDHMPMSMQTGTYNTPVCIVSDEWMDSHGQDLKRQNDLQCELYLRCEDAAGLEEIVRRDIGLLSYTLSNYETDYRAERSMFLLISIFLYGFIAVVALIGVTNIFNTVTTNMELRAPEFAMLRAVGMTDGEFRRMIRLEGLFYGGKALLIGLPLGVLLSVAFYQALGLSVMMPFRLPLEGMLLAVLAVFVLLYGILRYSMNKLEGRDLIRIIQNENI
ncbi:MAG: ABC transporter permease [Clostridium sp.]|nr:ABC transporter permease [Acetatifactor muris]MCM1528144.1 ABC transporter permease [Bacteroides sp.]MCM1564249.1 ABC transporter permease [Clostridium sp.]